MSNAKKIKMICVAVPYRLWIIFRKAWHLGAFCFTLQAKTANMKIWTVVPAASKNIQSGMVLEEWRN